jgi:hypothetical protein
MIFLNVLFAVFIITTATGLANTFFGTHPGITGKSLATIDREQAQYRAEVDANQKRALLIQKLTALGMKPAIIKQKVVGLDYTKPVDTLILQILKSFGDQS